MTDPTQIQIGTPQAIIPGLYLVATPIGNLRDISLRALDILHGVDEVYCEDTRVTGKLFKAFNVQKPLSIYNDHSHQKTRDTIIQTITQGKAIALVSDAGTPLISVPGYKLVRACQEAGVPVSAVPGANAPLTALQLSGLPTDAFSFIGFLPSKVQARREVLQKWMGNSAPVIAFESANRISKTLEDLIDIAEGCEIVIARELTKRFEEILRGRAQELFQRVNEKPLKGELVLIISQRKKQSVSESDVKAMLSQALKDFSVKDASEKIAMETGWAKKQLYDMALQLKS